MPHQCTNCGKVFDDGSKEMLSGCPVCGGNKFQFRPARPDDGPSSGESADERTPGESTAPTSGSAEGTAESNADSPRTTPNHPRETTPTREETTAAGDDRRGEPASSAESRAEGNRGSRRRTDAAREGEVEVEDRAQASARSDVVSPDELEAMADETAESRVPPEDVDGNVIEPETEERPGLEELREELNNQFESIKVLNPGQYELNLMELYDREEYIISLREDGRYVIEVPDTWRDAEE
ncbi:MAG: Zn-ribbon containing protein [Haloferacaceae archaeon]